MKEYVIHAKIKNNLLLERILKEAPNVRQWCAKHGIHESTVGGFVNLKQSAMTEDFEWRVGALQIAEALGVLPDELFTEEQQARAIKSNEVFIEMTRQQALECADPLHNVELIETVGKMLEAANLTDREEDVLRRRFYSDQTIEEIGRDYELSRERIRQIEAKALRKMRHPRVACGLPEEDRPLREIIKYD